MTILCDVIYLITILLFGTLVSYCFAGIAANRKNILFFLLFCVLEIILQTTLSLFGARDLLRKLYPALTHLPLIIFLVTIHKCNWLNAATSVFSAYLCCRIPWLFYFFFKLCFQGKIIPIVAYVIVTCLTFAGIYKYIAVPAAHFINSSKKNAVLIGSIPLLYYCFDYLAAVYTNLLYSNNRIAIQFMPTTLSVFYFLIIITYCKELALKAETTHQAETLNLQLQYSASTLENMRHLQENTMTYRHDMRHHLNYMQMLASSGHLEKLQNYIHAIQSDIEAVTPANFCRNEIVNLILSTYNLKAAKKDVYLDVHADVPEHISISDTNLCVVLSNALENALNATIETTEKIIHVKLAVRNSSLLIQISNPYLDEIIFKDHLPVSSKENHGFGTKSIASIVNAYHGQYEFFTENQLFILRILLPL